MDGAFGGKKYTRIENIVALVSPMGPSLHAIYLHVTTTTEVVLLYISHLIKHEILYYEKTGTRSFSMHIVMCIMHSLNKTVNPLYIN